MLNIIMRLFVVTIMQDSHGIMYGAPKYLRKSLFWYGQRLWEMLDNLIKRGFNLVNWCCMCRCNNKTVDHLLIHCAVAQELWTFIFAMFGVQWVMSRRVTDALACWWSWYAKRGSSSVNVDCMGLKGNQTFSDVEQTAVEMNSGLLRSTFECSWTIGTSDMIIWTWLWIYFPSFHT